MRVMVTGGAGFIGSHIVDALGFEGHDVAVVDNLSSVVQFHEPHIKCDIRRLSSLTSGFLVHCAARADIRANWDSEAERTSMWENNVDGTRALLDLADANQGGLPVVFLSTAAVYGGDTRESAPLAPQSPYAASKIAGEALVQAYAHRWGLPYYILRLSRVVGARYHHGHIADFARQALATGKVTPKSDGRAVASSVHVKDVASAVLACMGGQALPGIYNVSSGEWSARDTVEAMGLRDTTEWPDNPRGWVGDVSPRIYSGKLDCWGATHGIQAGVKEALAHLGWPPPNKKGKGKRRGA